MKKIIAIITGVLLSLSLTACSSEKLNVELKSNEVLTDNYGTAMIEGSYKGPYGPKVEINGEEIDISLTNGEDFSIPIELKDKASKEIDLNIYKNEESSKSKIKIKNDYIKRLEEKKKEKELKKKEKEAKRKEDEIKNKKQKEQKLKDIKTMEPDFIKSIERLREESDGLLISILSENDDYTALTVYVNQDIKYLENNQKTKIMDELGKEIQNRVNGYFNPNNTAFITFKYDSSKEVLGVSKMFNPATFKLKDK